MLPCRALARLKQSASSSPNLDTRIGTSTLNTSRALPHHPSSPVARSLFSLCLRTSQAVADRHSRFRLLHYSRRSRCWNILPFRPETCLGRPFTRTRSPCRHPLTIPNLPQLLTRAHAGHAHGSHERPTARLPISPGIATRASRICDEQHHSCLIDNQQACRNRFCATVRPIDVWRSMQETTSRRTIRVTTLTCGRAILPRSKTSTQLLPTIRLVSGYTHAILPGLDELDELDELSTPLSRALAKPRLSR